MRGLGVNFSKRGAGTTDSPSPPPESRKRSRTLVVYGQGAASWFQAMKPSITKRRAVPSMKNTW